MPPANIATAADYADATMIARRAKNTLFMLLALMLIIQIATFFVARMTNYILPETNKSLAESLPPATAPTAATQPAEAHGRITPSVLRYLTALIDFLGIVLVIVLAVILLLIVKIMLVGRLIGVAQVTSAFIWCVVGGAMLFPVQPFLRRSGCRGPFHGPAALY